MNPFLTICIATLPERKSSFDRLCSELYKQRNEIPNGMNLIQIITDDAERGAKTIGAKSNDMIKKAKGKYILRIDDDDMPSKHYLHLLLEAIAQNDVDIITFNMDYYIDDKYNKTWVVNRFIGNDWSSKHWAINYNPTHRFTVDRIFYHLMAVKRELAEQVGFINANNAEDVSYSDDLIPLIKTEFHIDHTLLNIFFSSTKTQNA